MVLKWFFVYAGAFLAGAVALVFVAKSFAPGFSINTKKPVLQGGLTAVVASGAAYGATLFSDYLFTVYWAFAGLFLLLGIIHVLFFHKKYFYTGNDKKAVVGEIVFMLALIFFIVVVFLCLQFFLGNKNFLFLPMLMSMLAFFIPLSVYYCFEAAYNIPESDFPTWQYPVNQIELPDENPNEKILVIAFEACKNITDTTKINFRAKGPETMKLGELYYHFINDYNEFQSETPIQYNNDDGRQEWWFRIKPKWYQRHRILDPQLSVRENRIRENSVIICERV